MDDYEVVRFVDAVAETLRDERKAALLRLLEDPDVRIALARAVQQGHSEEIGRKG